MYEKRGWEREAVDKPRRNTEYVLNQKEDKQCSTTGGDMPIDIGG